MPIYGNEEHKQRVNLSSFAQSVLEIDRNVFSGSGSYSGFLNRIISSFRDKATASVDTAAAQRQRFLLANGYSLQIAEQLTAEYREQLKQKITGYPQGDSIVFRLNNKNFNMLYEEHAESSAYSAPSKYLKALFEEYARLSPSERERIYYSELVEQTLQPAIDAGYILEVNLGGKVFLVKPYGVMADPFNSHLYLIGLSKRADYPSEQETIASFRITRISEAKSRRHPRGRLSVDEKRQIERRLQAVGVQYLVGEQDFVKIRLTPSGVRLFLQKSYMRPIPESVEDDVYLFHCSSLQIRNYFLSFGKEAQVLEPESLREEFLAFYKEAVLIYK